MDAERQESRDRLNDDGLARPDAQENIAETPPDNIGGEFGDVEAKRQVIAARRAQQEEPARADAVVTRISRGGEVPNETEPGRNNPPPRPS